MTAPSEDFTHRLPAVCRIRTGVVLLPVLKAARTYESYPGCPLPPKAAPQIFARGYPDHGAGRHLPERVPFLDHTVSFHGNLQKTALIPASVQAPLRCIHFFAAEAFGILSDPFTLLSCSSWQGFLQKQICELPHRPFPAKPLIRPAAPARCPVPGCRPFDSSRPDMRIRVDFLCIRTQKQAAASMWKHLLQTGKPASRSEAAAAGAGMLYCRLPSAICRPSSWACRHSFGNSSACRSALAAPSKISLA